MNAATHDLVRKIEAIPDNPFTGLAQLRDYCKLALQVIPLSDKAFQEMHSTVWMLDEIMNAESSFERWLLFILRSKKAKCVSILKNNTAVQMSIVYPETYEASVLHGEEQRRMRA